MAFLTDQEQDDVLDGNVSAGASIPLGGTDGGGAVTPTSPSGTGAPAAGAGGAGPAPATSAGQSIGGLSDSLGRVSQDFSDLYADFREEAGPSRTFGTSDRNTLLRATHAPEGQETDAFTKARDLLSSSYQGPQGLDQEQVAGLRHEAGQARGVSGELAGGRGLTAASRLETPGLTAGEARFEAQRANEGKGLQRQALGVHESAGQALGEIGERTQKAERVADQRTRQEQAIADASRRLLGRVGTGLESGVERRIQEEQAAQEALRDAYRRFQETGDFSELEGITETAPFEGGSYATQEEASRAAERVMGEFPGLEGIAPARSEIGRTGFVERRVDIGGETYSVDQLRSGHKRVEGMSPEESKALGEELWQRQNKLDALFAGAGIKSETTEFNQGEAGRYAGYNPELDAYTNLQREVIDPRAFFELEGGGDLSPQTVGTGGELNRMNNIARLLGSEIRLTPREMAELRVAADQAGFEDAELRAEESFRTQSDAMGSKIRDAADFQRESYEQYVDKLNSGLFGLGGAVGGVTGLILGGPMGGIVGGVLDKELSEEF